LSYDANSIQQLTFREGCRKRIGIYLGSADNKGVINGLLELVNNATDEALVCKTANKIEINVWSNKASVRDYGRGMPHGKNEFTDEVMINLLTENHSGGKFDDNSYGGKSRGLNGTGSAATCCSSDWFNITSYRDNAAWYMEFKEGIPQFSACKKLPLNNTPYGTYIEYQPSQEVFAAEDIKFDYAAICQIIKEYSYFNKGVTFIVKDMENNTINKYISNNGLIDFAKENIPNPINKKPLYTKISENGIDVEMIIQWTTGSEKFYLFSNGGENPDGGTPITGIRTAITNFMKKHLTNEINPELGRAGLVYICSINMKNPIYNGQIKSKITNPELRGLCQRITTTLLNDFAKTSEFKVIIDMITKLNKAERAAERAKTAVLQATKDIEKNQKRKVFASDKLKDAEFLGQNSILLVCEGDSALGGMSQARDPKSYGLMAIRGKIINALSNEEDKIMNNEEVKLLFSALNIIPNNYSNKKLRYGKLAICSDSDSDGYHIGLLIMSLLYKYAPNFIKEGRLCWLRSPLFIVENGKKRQYYFNDEEFNQAKNSGKVHGEVHRAKGLGALEPIEAHESMFTKEYQRLDVLNPDNESFSLLESLMGNQIEARKQFVFNNIDFNEIKE
jgi:DNA gyrase subunit B